MASQTAPSSGEITILVCVGGRMPVKLGRSSLESLKAEVLSQFADILPAAKFGLLFQIKDDNWGGMFMDIVEGQSISDWSVVKVVVDTTPQRAPLQVCPTMPCCHSAGSYIICMTNSLGTFSMVVETLLQLLYLYI